jgi:hypothetical protein
MRRARAPRKLRGWYGAGEFFAWEPQHVAVFRGSAVHLSLQRIACIRGLHSRGCIASMEASASPPGVSGPGQGWADFVIENESRLVTETAGSNAALKFSKLQDRTSDSSVSFVGTLMLAPTSSASFSVSKKFMGWSLRSCQQISIASAVQLVGIVANARLLFSEI